MKELELSMLKKIRDKIKTGKDTSRARIAFKIANYFFKFHSKSPLTSLKKLMETIDMDESTQIEKNLPIWEFLKTVPDAEIQKHTKIW